MSILGKIQAKKSQGVLLNISKLKGKNMPIPEKKDDETRQQFIGRCMSDDIMKKDYKDPKQRIAVCLIQTKPKNAKSDLLQEVDDRMYFDKYTWDDDWNEFTHDSSVDDIYDEDGLPLIYSSAEEKPKSVKLNKPVRTPNGPKKFSVYVKNEKGNVVKVNFGDPNMEIKRDDPERRKSYRARHNCDNPGPKWKANYWSCKMWSTPKVSDLT